MQTDAAVRHQQEFTKTTLGFWIYLMTDCVLFGSLFATYAVLRHGTAGGPGAGELFDLNFVLIETLLLLTSSLTSGLALVAVRSRNVQLIASMLMLTFALGTGFLVMELSEFHKLAISGAAPETATIYASMPQPADRFCKAILPEQHRQEDPILFHFGRVVQRE